MSGSENRQYEELMAAAVARLRERDKISICAWRLLCAENGVILFRKT